MKQRSVKVFAFCINTVVTVLQASRNIDIGICNRYNITINQENLLDPS